MKPLVVLACVLAFHLGVEPSHAQGTAARSRRAADAQLLAAFDTLRVPVDSVTHRIAYAGEAALPGTTAAELYERARWWLAAAFHADFPELQVENRNGRGLRLEATTECPATSRFLGRDIPCTTTVQYTLWLNFYEGHYGYEVSDLHETRYAGEGAFTINAETWYDRVRQPTTHPRVRVAAARSFLTCDRAARALVASLRQVMATPAAVVDNW